jgi:SAM-dependent methyltransferase
MREESAWRPSKFERRGGRWRASRDPREVARGSRITADLALRACERALEKHARGDLLDYGCGRAPFYGIYRSRVKTVTCVDWPASPHDIRHADHEVDLNLGTTLPDASFDTVLCTDVLEHLWAPQTALEDIARVLRPGGRLVLSVPFLYGLHEQPHDYFRYTKYALRRLCSSAGLKVVRIRAYGGRPEVLADLLMKAVARRRRPSAALETVLRLALRLRRDHTRGGYPSRTRYPLGYVLVARKPVERGRAGVGA